MEKVGRGRAEAPKTKAAQGERVGQDANRRVNRRGAMLSVLGHGVLFYVHEASVRIWQAGKKREALRIGFDPVSPAKNVLLSIGNEMAIAAEAYTTGLYTGIVKLVDGRQFEYEFNSF